MGLTVVVSRMDTVADNYMDLAAVAVTMAVLVAVATLAAVEVVVEATVVVADTAAADIAK
jgi:hypothetical protein